MVWLRLIRWSNLLIIFLTQLLTWAFVIMPIKYYLGIDLLLTPVNFLLIATSTVLIAAAGYMINDYFDIKIDVINRPERMVLEKNIPRRKAILLHTVLNIIAILLSAIVAHQVGHYEWLLLQLACTLLLWFYSTRFKRMFITGNVVVALLTSLSILTLLLYEPALQSLLIRPSFIVNNIGARQPNPVYILGVYTYFAFILTWMREIVKDMEDIKGDEAEGCETMPIVWGLNRTTGFTQKLGFFAFTPLLIGAWELLNAHWNILAIYIVAFLIIPIISWILFLPKEHTTAHYAKASKKLKYIMVLGVGSLILYFLQQWLRLS